MNANRTGVVAASAALLVSHFLAVPIAAQTLFETEDFRADRELWTDPAYYLNNTVEELRGMALDLDSGGMGSGQIGRARSYASGGTGRVGAMELASPYPFASAAEHYAAWLEEADGGTQHTYSTMPDWRGRWGGGGDRIRGGANPASSVVAMLTLQYQEYFVQDMKAYTEGRIWGANSFCLPGGFVTSVTDAEEFIVTPDRVWILGAGNNRNYIRWIYTDGSGHTAGDFRYPKWHGESVGFWNGEVLVVYTNQIRGWKGGLDEFTDNLETVERYQRVGDAIEGEIVFYDAEVFVQPVYSKLVYNLDGETRPELRPLYNTCTDTNGPSTKVYLDERGFLNERLPGDPLYWDATDPRPWATYLNISDERYEIYLENLEGEGN